MHLVVPSLELQKPATSLLISHQNVPKPGMVLSSHAGHRLGFALQSFLQFFLFFLHLFPPVDLHVLKSVSQPALQSAKTTHGGGEATGAEGEGGGEATGEGGGGDTTGTGGGGEGGGGVGSSCDRIPTKEGY